MKKTATALLTMVFLIVFLSGISAQPYSEDEIRDLEKRELEALLKVDTAALFNKLWSPDMVVNTPANRVGTVEETKKSLLAGRIAYSYMERNIEKITFKENIAIVMGHEILRPKGLSDNVGKTVTRRFTNLWMRSATGWSMVARQATIISVQ
ncbi:MAG TPA: nuclear transport factor 2 family protein [Bacteroidales bacterium]|nr:nuclear transport factor 2 family protein [Bacteroidales bacterium]